jgi:threonine aldolase
MVGWFTGCLVRPISTADGILTWEMVERHVRPLGPHWAPTGLIEVENTHNMAGGTVYPMAVLNEICDRAHELGLPVHMDGARIFNAAVHLDLRVAEVCAKADTVMFCLSKGLGAPVGSLLAGTRDAMDEARLLRKRLGGGMRQAGVLAAAGLISLEKMPERLHEDHANARYLAVELAGMRGISVNPALVHTNIVVFDIAGTGMNPPMLSAELKARGVLANGVSRTEMRMVTHYDVSRADCEDAVAAVRQIVALRQVARS